MKLTAYDSLSACINAITLAPVRVRVRVRVDECNDAWVELAYQTCRAGDVDMRNLHEPVKVRH
jgi:hypothetical protein